MLLPGESQNQPPPSPQASRGQDGNSTPLSDSAPELGFDEGVRAFLKKVVYREATTESEKERIYRLRYAAYRREGALPPGAPEIFKDRFDDVENGATFGLYVDGRLASSLRLHVAHLGMPDSPAASAFSDYLGPRIEDGLVVVDPNRFVVDASSARLYPKLPYATVRLAWMAGDHFGADLGLATVRTEHQAFYRRLFRQRVVCDARPYPTLTKPLSLMVIDYRNDRESVMRRYPFLRSTETEREAIFGRPFSFRSGKRQLRAPATA